jgi:hypothetical protein
MNVKINQTQSNVTQTPVLCKDGTTQIQLSSPNAKYMDACRNNGGRAENQTTSVKPRNEVLKQSLSDYSANLPKDAKTQKTQSLVVIAVVLVAGYFAYKKFKK